MKTTILLAIILFVSGVTAYTQSVGIGTETPHNSALLDISSINKGVLIPRMTDTERNAIPSPADGLLVYVTTDSVFYCYNGSAWVALNAWTQEVMDQDKDTKVMVEKTPDEDVIHFTMKGTEYFRMDSGRLEVFNTGRSVFFGSGAGHFDNLNNHRSVAVGDSALFKNTDGATNVAIGYKSLFANQSGSNNTASGVGSLYASMTGYDNCAYGFESLNKNTTGHNNVASGYRSLYWNTVGIENVAIGSLSMEHQKGSRNTAVGNEAFRGYSPFGTPGAGSDNTAIGHLALLQGHNSSGNTSVGSKALYENFSGNNNTAVGYMADVSVSSLTNATAIGAKAIVSADSCLVLGNAANVGIGTSAPLEKLHVEGTIRVDQKIQADDAGGLEFATDEGTTRMVVDDNGSVGIGTSVPLNMLHVEGTIRVDQRIQADDAGGLEFATDEGTTRMVVDDNGNVGIGTTTPSYPLQVVGAANGPDPAYFLHMTEGHGSGGTGWNYSIYASSGVYSALGFGTGSDARIKDILGLSDSYADLATLMKINITDYRYRDSVMRGNGVVKKVIAQDVEKVLPQAVTISTEVIPDIYTLAEVRTNPSGSTELHFAEDFDINAGDRLRLILYNGAMQMVTVASASPHAVVLDSLDQNGLQDEVFVYGREVDDFRSVDYDAISMLNVSATQELAKQNAALRQTIEQLMLRVAALEQLAAPGQPGHSQSTVASEDLCLQFRP